MQSFFCVGWEGCGLQGLGEIQTKNNAYLSNAGRWLDLSVNLIKETVVANKASSIAINSISPSEKKRYV